LLKDGFKIKTAKWMHEHIEQKQLDLLKQKIQASQLPSSLDQLSAPSVREDCTFDAKRSFASPETQAKAVAPIEVVVEDVEASESLPPTSADAASLVAGSSASPLVAMVQKH
jgi:hypothetical protein